MFTFKQFVEARRNPEQNPKLSVYDQIKDYVDKENCFVSFTSIEKIGINPGSSYQTPNGIYCYPLKKSIEVYDIDAKKGLYDQFPFASTAPWFWMFQAKNVKNLLILSDLSYKKSDYVKDIKKLEIFYGKSAASIDFNTFVDEAEKSARVQTYSGKIWNITRCASSNWNPNASKSSPNKWNKILKDVLGYDGAVDIDNIGIIHPSERLQAVFFHKGGIDVIAKIKNNEAIIDISTIDKDSLTRTEWFDWLYNVIDELGRDKVWFFLQKITNENALKKIIGWGSCDNIIEAMTKGNLKPTVPVLWEIMKYYKSNRRYSIGEIAIKKMIDIASEKELIAFTQEWTSYTECVDLFTSAIQSGNFPNEVLNKVNSKAQINLILREPEIFKLIDDPDEEVKIVYNVKVPTNH